jgi:3-oxoacyl-[acyl-carrier protein] reductase
MGFMDLGLRDKVYVVTGGTRGLGLATAEALVADGAKVVISARDEDRVAATVEHLGGSRSALGLAGDLSDAELAPRLAAAASGMFGRIDGALVSVGGPPPGTPLAVSDDSWRGAFESVFLGAVRVTRAVAASLSDEGGSIAFVLSTSVKAPIEGLATSNGLRPGLAMLAKDLADELGPRNIRVNSLLPGRIDTERVRELDKSTGRADASRKRWSERIPLRRYGEPAEFGRVAAFILSPAASFLSGVALAVDGGMTRAL